MLGSTMRVLLLMVVVFQASDSVNNGVCYKDLYSDPATYNDDMIDKLYPELFKHPIDKNGDECTGYLHYFEHPTFPGHYVDVIRWVCPAHISCASDECTQQHGFSDNSVGCRTCLFLHSYKKTFDVNAKEVWPVEFLGSNSPESRYQMVEEGHNITGWSDNGCSGDMGGECRLGNATVTLLVSDKRITTAAELLANNYWFSEINITKYSLCQSSGSG